MTMLCIDNVIIVVVFKRLIVCMLIIINQVIVQCGMPVDCRGGRVAVLVSDSTAKKEEDADGRKADNDKVQERAVDGGKAVEVPAPDKQAKMEDQGTPAV